MLAPARHARLQVVLILPLLLLAAGWLGTSVRAAGTWYVSPAGSDSNTCAAPAAPCQTIQAAIEKAASGDTIVVAAGTYTENVAVLDKDLNIAGSGSAQTTIRDPDAGGESDGVVGINRTVNLSGFTLRDGSVGLSIGIDGVVTGTDLLITDNNRSSDPPSFSGHGLFNDGRAVLRSSRIQNHVSRFYGGGVFNYGELTLQDVVIINNVANWRGAGIYQRESFTPELPDPIKASMRLDNVAIINNRVTGTNAPDEGYGGGIMSYAPLIIDRTLLQDNTALYGGGIYSSSSLTISNSTATGNRAEAGGAIDTGSNSMQDPPVTITNVTLSNNTAPYGAALAHNDIPALVTNATIVGNVGVAVSSSSNLQLKNTIIAGSSVANCDSSAAGQGYITSLGNNIDSGASCGFNAPGDKSNTVPVLGPLQNNGGPWPTHALLAGSAAIDTGTNQGCPATDQRGAARPVDGTNIGSPICDIGAFEFGSVVPAPSPSPSPSPPAGVQRVFLPFTGR